MARDPVDFTDNSRNPEPGGFASVRLEECSNLSLSLANGRWVSYHLTGCGTSILVEEAVPIWSPPYTAKDALPVRAKS